MTEKPYRRVRMSKEVCVCMFVGGVCGVGDTSFTTFCWKVKEEQTHSGIITELDWHIYQRQSFSNVLHNKCDMILI